MKKLATAVLALTLLAAPAIACMGMLVRTDLLIGGVACTYQLPDGSHVRSFIAARRTARPACSRSPT